MQSETRKEGEQQHNLHCIIPDLTDFFLKMTEKRSRNRLKKEIFIIVKNIVLTKNWFVFSNF